METIFVHRKKLKLYILKEVLHCIIQFIQMNCYLAMTYYNDQKWQ